MGRKRGWASALVLVVAIAGCGWRYPGYDAGGTRNNPFESRLSESNVSGLTEHWRAPSAGGLVLSAKGRVYTPVGVSDTEVQLAAYDGSGTVGCTGSPKVCSPLLTFSAPPCGGCLSEGFGVADDVVYRWKGDDTGDTPDGVVAFDATGAEGCDAPTRVCQPIRTYVTGPGIQIHAMASPVVVGGVLYVVSFSLERLTGELVAFDARGVQSCTPAPVVCSPIWTALLPSFPVEGTAPAFANGVMYVSTESALAAVATDGRTNCAGSPTVCFPLWVSAGASTYLHPPAVVNGRVYVSDNGQMRVYDAAGAAGCVAHVCSPLWSSVPAPSGSGIPLVTSDRVYVPAGGQINAYHLDGTLLPGTIPLEGDVTGANGLVVVSKLGSSPVRVFSPAGSELWRVTEPSLSESCSDALIADGQLLACLRGDDGQGYVRGYGIG